jgi:hypothetical protein
VIDTITPRGGVLGAAVSIVGSGFGAATGQVVFDPLGVNVAAPITAWGPNQVDITVPAGLPENQFVVLGLETAGAADGCTASFWVPATVIPPGIGLSGLDYQYPAFEEGQGENEDDPRTNTAADYNRLLDKVLALAGGTPVATPVVEVVRNYTVGVGVLDLVYQKSDGTVDKVDITDVSRAVPVVGFVSALDSPVPGQCLVRSAGDLTGFTGLVPGKLYIASKVLGGIVADDDVGNPNYPGPIGSGNVSREVGAAVTSTTLFIGVIRDFDVL